MLDIDCNEFSLTFLEYKRDQVPWFYVRDVDLDSKKNFIESVESKICNFLLLVEFDVHKKPKKKIWKNYSSIFNPINL